MSVSSPSALHQDPLLSNVGSRFRNMGFIADRILTAVPVPSRTFKYMVWDDVAFDLHDTQLTSKARPNEISISGTKTDGSTDTHALADVIDPQEQEQAGGQIPLLTIATQTIADGLFLRREKTAADALTSTSVITQNDTLAGSDQWSHADSDPQKAVREAADSLLVKPNIMVMGRAVASALTTHPKVREAFKGQALPKITLDWLAAYFEVDEIIVGESWYNTARKGQARSLSRVWGKDAFLAYRAPAAPSPLMDIPTLGYLPNVGGSTPGNYNGQGAPPMRVYTGRDGRQGTGEGVTWVKGEIDYKVLVTAPRLAFLFKAAVA